MKVNSTTFIAALFLLLFLQTVAAAQENTSIEGLITGAETGLPVSGSHVVLVDTPYGTVSDELGRFYFYAIPPDYYELDISHIAYKPQQRRVYVPAGGEAPMIEVHLDSKALTLPEVRVQSDVKPTQGTLSGARIISRETIRKSNASSIGRVLELEGLATVSSDGSPGGAQTVSIRGSASDQVLVLLDGQPLNDAADGIADLSRISLMEVQQIEVYPEAPPSLGAQAIGGAINIVTFKPGLSQYRVQAGISEFGEKMAAFSLGRSVGGWPVLGILEHRESTGAFHYTIAPDDGLDLFTRNVGNTYSRTDADYRRDYFSLKLDPPGIMSMGMRHTELFRHNPDYLPLTVLEHESTTEDRRQEINLSFAGDSAGYRPEFQVKAESYRQRTVTDYGPQFPLLYSQTDLRGEAYRMELKWQQKRLHWSEVHFGGGINFERLWSMDLTNGYAERLHEFGYVQIQGDPLQVFSLPLRTGLFSGVRADLYSGEEAFVHPRLGLELGGGEAFFWSFRAELAGAYRLPSFNSLFWMEDLQSSGNPNLKPERSQNREVSGRLGIEPIEVNLTYFDRNVWDLIYWRLDFDNRWKPLNISSTKIYGAEFSLRGKTDHLFFNQEFLLSYRWTRALNRSGESNTDGKLLPYRPEHAYTLSLRQDLRYIEVDISSRWVSRRYTNEANTKSLAPYNVWDLGMSKRFIIHKSGTSVNLRLEARNLFNEEYRIVAAAPTPLREFRISVGVESY